MFFSILESEDHSELYATVLKMHVGGPEFEERTEDLKEKEERNAYNKILSKNKSSVHFLFIF